MHGSDGGGAFLDIPTREGKPRTRGLTHVIDKGLNLREIEGLSYEEIAAAMDCPVGTVRSRIFRAREAIDRALQPLLD